jgi:hypothetical protein
MTKKLFLAFLLVAFVAMPAFASVQNIKISGSINSTFLNRENFDLGTSSDFNEEQNIFLTQTNLRIDADLTDNVSTTVSLINERAWTSVANDDDSTNININLAYVTLREMLYSPLTVVIGRQNIKYGNNFIVGGGIKPTNSGLTYVASDLRGGRAFDAVRAILDYSPLKIEVMAAKINANSMVTNDAEADKDDADFFGTDATYELGDSMDTLVESYFFAKYDRTDSADYTNDVYKKQNTIYTPGFRVSTNPIKGLNLQAEYAHQFGTYTHEGFFSSTVAKRNANAVQLTAGYTLPVLEKYNPLAQYVFTYVSGDDGKDGTDNVWDPMYESQGAGKIYNVLFPLADMQIHEFSLQVAPIQDVTTKLGASVLWLDKKSNGYIDAYFGTADGTTVSSLAVKDGKRFLGTEVDWNTTYAYTEDVQFGANLGVFVPGDVFYSASGKTASQALFNVNVNF